MAAGAAEVLALGAAAGTVFFVFVVGAGARGSAAGLGSVAFSGAGAADGAGSGELTFVAAAVVGVIADSTAFKFAGLCVTAGVVAAAFFVAAVTLLVAFNDAVAALAAANGDDAAVVGQTSGLDAVLANGRADVTDCTLRKLSHGVLSIGVHDVFRAGIASR